MKLQSFRNYNQPDRVTGLRPNPNLATDIYFDNSDGSHYPGWQTSLRKRYSQGLLFNAHYTWSKAISYDDGDKEFFNVKANRDLFERRPA